MKNTGSDAKIMRHLQYVWCQLTNFRGLKLLNFDKPAPKHVETYVFS